MPNYFSLTRKSNPAAGPVPLATIDDEMREHFKAPADPNNYYWHWVDIIGFALATGATFAELRDRYTSYRNAAETPEDASVQQKGLDIVNWLDEHFISDAWARIGK